MKTSITDFMLNQQPFAGVEVADLIIHQCDFAVKGYQDTFFTELGIAFPDSLNRAVNKRKAEFLAGRYCAKTALAQLGISNYAITVGKHRCPVWPAGVKGSITHSNTTALAVVTSQATVLGVGIDIESIITEKTMSDIQDAILYGDDYQLLERPGIAKEVLFSLIFSIKESFFKAAYPSTGYYFDFDAVRITELDFDNHRFTLRLCQDLNPQLSSGAVFSGQFCLLEGQVLSLLVL